MLKATMLSFALLCAISGVAQQSWYTKAGVIRFESKAPLEDIEATNKSVTAVFQPAQGKLQFSVLMRGFEFRKALMQEHFNENYVESDKYPRGSFTGQIVEPAAINLGDLPASGTVKVRGELTIHGVTNPVEANGKISREGDRLLMTSVFNIKLSDYKIAIPALVKDKVSNSVTIVVNCNLQPRN